ncbi:MAG: protein translocase subunit SecF [Deltaproteobacteria bacterium]|nr:protein translocase subunit SecF [Deltaproteobacteria bacterium]
MELIPHNTSINFIKYKNYFIVGSIIVNLLVLVAVGAFKLNWGVDFAGGSELEVKFAEPVKDVAVREAVEAAGFKDATVQVFGPPSDNSFLIRVGRISLLTQEQAKKAEDAVKARFGPDFASFDFNEEFGDKIELRFKKVPAAADVRSVLEGTGIKVQELRTLGGGFTVITSGISAKVDASLKEAAGKKLLPQAELRRVEYVGPQVGKQLQRKGILAVLYAAIAILAYIALRFDTRFAPGAVVAMFHDIIVVFGYFVVSRREFNLTSVAVLLTIVGYSVNDTIVVYDRIRENLTKIKGMALPQLINISINETLSRTILTSFTTILALVGLLIFGVGQIWDFAAAMFLGIFVGTYSSIYIASPVTIWLDELRGKSHHAEATAPSAAKPG